MSCGRRPLEPGSRHRPYIFSARRRPARDRQSVGDPTVVEQALGRKVAAYTSMIHDDSDLAVELFVLEPGPEVSPSPPTTKANVKTPYNRTRNAVIRSVTTRQAIADLPKRPNRHDDAADASRGEQAGGAEARHRHLVAHPPINPRLALRKYGTKEH
jgi:hypothetical protein